MKQHVLEVPAVGQAFPKEFTTPYSSSFLTPGQGPTEVGSSHWHRIFFPGMGRVTAATLGSSQCRLNHGTCRVGKFLILSMQGEWFHGGKKAAVGTQKALCHCRFCCGEHQQRAETRPVIGSGGRSQAPPVHRDRVKGPSR